jgi:hypothetical protein
VTLLLKPALEQANSGVSITKLRILRAAVVLQQPFGGLNQRFDYFGNGMRCFRIF